MNEEIITPEVVETPAIEAEIVETETPVEPELEPTIEPVVPVEEN